MSFDEADSNLYALKSVHLLLTMENETLQKMMFSKSEPKNVFDNNLMKTSPLDWWRMRAEMYIFVRSMSKLYCDERIEYNPSKMSDEPNSAPGHTKRKRKKRDDNYEYEKIPALLSYSYLSSILEVGDLVDYCPIDPGSSDEAVVKRGTVSRIVFNIDAEDTSVRVAEDPTVVETCHFVRRITMRDFHTDTKLWNPIRQWSRLDTFVMNPTDTTTNAQLVADMKVDSENDVPDVALEMIDPKNILDDVSKKLFLDGRNMYHERKRQRSNQDNASKRLDKTMIGNLGSSLNWLKGIFLKKEIGFVNDAYRTLLSLGDRTSIPELLSAKDKASYDHAKTNLKNKIRDRQKNLRWLTLKLLLPLLFITRFINDSGESEQVVHEGRVSEPQAARIFQTVEKTILLERDNSLVGIQTCDRCRENHMNVIPTELVKEAPYCCALCKKHKVSLSYYNDKRLQPIWYERRENATSYDDYKLDSDNNRIVRYDIPTELSSLTMSEQLLIRKCAPYIPSVHMSGGFFALDGQCIAFPQDIDDMVNELPRRPENIVTFVRQMGNKETSEVHLKHLRVRRNKVIDALKWLKLHNSEYKDITINEDRLDWMKNKESATLTGTKTTVSISESSSSTKKQYVSKVQCAGELNPDDDQLEFTTMAPNNVHVIPNEEQSKHITELSKLTKTTSQSEKLLLFPPHGDTPVRYVISAIFTFD